MRRPSTTSRLAATATAALLSAGFPPPAPADCTGGCRDCLPACRGSWAEKPSSQPVYSMTCEYACARGRDPWHAPPPESRCHPPCGDVIVKKRLYKAEGPARTHRVPKYEVAMVPDEPSCATCCHCRHAEGHAVERTSWNPLDIVRRLAAWW